MGVISAAEAPKPPAKNTQENNVKSILIMLKQIVIVCLDIWGGAIVPGFWRWREKSAPIG